MHWKGDTPRAPARWVATGEVLTTSFDVSFTPPAVQASTWLLTGVDWTATQAQPVHCFTHLALGPEITIFYWDSQSTGEGLGVRWSWRGDLPLFPGDELIIHGDSSAAIVWSATAWGILAPESP